MPTTLLQLQHQLREAAGRVMEPVTIPFETASCRHSVELVDEDEAEDEESAFPSQKGLSSVPSVDQCTEFISS